MTTIESGAIRLPVAALGAESPLPPLPGRTDVHASVPTEGVPDEVARNMNYGFPTAMLPYTTQDGYGRDRVEADLPVVTLDNGILRATVAPTLGGRLWSLVHLPTGRELLYRNPVLQPANLALRNAWFSGGVEWNLGTTGHTPLTCSPMHTAELDGPDGPILRLWEFERLREVTYQLDFSLPPGSAHLYVAVRIVNPNDVTVPMYWWSNTAVPDNQGSRVIAPAAESYRFSYERRLELVTAPEDRGHDYSYPGNAEHAADYFFRCSDRRRPWVAAVDAEGVGLVQTSTARLYGRKLFVWGNGIGGRRWQEWLTEPGTEGYLEIQAGLAHTQLEHLPMPADTSWTWLETYGPIEVAAADAHGDWARAQAAVAEVVDEEVSSDRLDARLREWDRWWDAPPSRFHLSGSNWGAIEQLRRDAAAEPTLTRPGTPFIDDPDDDATLPWRTLITTGALPSAESQDSPTSYATSSGWRHLLDSAPTDWLVLYHRGLGHVAAGDTDAAIEAWQSSVAEQPSAWAHRALGYVLRTKATDDAEVAHTAADHYRKAALLAGDTWQVIAETCDALSAIDADQEALDLLDRTAAEHGQLTMRRIKALTRLGRLDEAAQIFDDGFDVANLREGEETLDTLWFALARRRVLADGIVPADSVEAEARRRHRLPDRYNFRMSLD